MQSAIRNLVAFSFYATKNLTTAEGGMLTGEPDLIDRARFIEELKARNIGTSVHFIPIHLHPYLYPTTVTRRRKPLRPNLLASWELRVEQYRVYYQVEHESDADTVIVVAVGKKTRQRVTIGGVEVQL